MDARKVYNKLAENYDLRQTNPATTILRKMENRLIRKFSFGKVLDLGCGSGEHLYKETFGLDLSENILKIAKNKSDFLIQGDIEELPLKPNSFDSVTCFYGTLNLVDLERSAKEINSILIPGGSLLLSVISVRDIDKHRSSKNNKIKKFRIEGIPINMRLFEKQEIMSAFERNGFKTKYFSSLFRMQKPRWGNFQKFSFLEKIKLKADGLLPKKLGRIYLFVFEKN